MNKLKSLNVSRFVFTSLSRQHRPFFFIKNHKLNLIIKITDKGFLKRRITDKKVGFQTFQQLKTTIFTNILSHVQITLWFYLLSRYVKSLRPYYLLTIMLLLITLVSQVFYFIVLCKYLI